MKTPIMLITFLFAFPLLMMAQQQDPNTVEFEYDDAGNRYLRHAIYIPDVSKSLYNQADSIKNRNIAKAIAADSIIINNVSVSIYPNPTLGKFKVKFDNFSDEDDIQYSLFSLTGQLIVEGQVNNATTEVDLQNHDNGPYLFKLIINGKSKSWRIIKR